MTEETQTQHNLNRQYFVIFAAVVGAAAMLTMALLLAAPWREAPERAAVTVKDLTGPDVDLKPLEHVFELRPIPTYAPPASAEPTAPPHLATSPDEPGAVVEAAAPPRSDELMPTYSWVNVFGVENTLDGEPVQPGAVVTAYDPAGNLIGRTTVQTEGEYGIMALYQDDPATPEDEGAEPGDEITFMIDGYLVEVLGPHEPVWTANGAVLMLNLAASTDSQAVSSGQQQADLN